MIDPTGHRSADKEKIGHLANPEIPQMADASQEFFLYTEFGMKRLRTLLDVDLS